MLKLKEMLTKPVIYQGLEVVVPSSTNFMWLRQSDNKTELLASPNKPEWHNEQQYYLAPLQTSRVAILEHVELTAQQVKESLEADDSVQQLDVVVNLIKNLRSFANSLERNVNAAKLNSSAEAVQALMNHVYAEEGELDTFITNAIDEAEHYGISTDVDHTEDDDDDINPDDYADIIKLFAAVVK